MTHRGQFLGASIALVILSLGGLFAFYQASIFLRRFQLTIEASASVPPPRSVGAEEFDFLSPQ